jgi:hypothetical protein
MCSTSTFIRSGKYAYREIINVIRSSFPFEWYVRLRCSFGDGFELVGRSKLPCGLGPDQTIPIF